jgi:tetratricopeptide (TPR) repeat protein
MRSLTWMSMAFAALLAVLPSAARADKIWDECTSADGSRAYEACQAILKRGVAESAYNRAIAYFYLGHLTYISGDFHGAIAFYTEAIRLDPTMAEAYAGRGWVHHASGEYEPAVADYDAAIKLNPNLVDTLDNRGDALVSLGQYDKAILDYDDVLKRDPSKTYVYRSRRLAYLKAGAYTKAVEDLEQARTLRPDFTDIEANLDAARAALAGQPAAAAARQQPAGVPNPAPSVALGTRVALVIGNSAYDNVPALPNPANDAQAIAQVLRDEGFRTVHLVEDATRANLARALQEFQEEADSADWAVVYYAGHGIEIGGTNYLVPVDARLKSDRDAPNDEAISLNRVLDAVAGAKNLKLVMLDACRDNPFGQSMQRSLAVRSVARGSPASSRKVARSWSMPRRTAMWPRMAPAAIALLPPP